MNEKNNRQYDKGHHQIIMRKFEDYGKWRQKFPDETLKLEGAQFDEGQFFHTIFTPCILDGAIFNNSHFIEAHLKEATFNDTVFKDCKLEKVNFKEAVFDNVRFEKATFTKCNFQKAIFKNSRIEDCRFFAIEGSGPLHLTFDDCTIINTNIDFLASNTIIQNHCKVIDSTFVCRGKNHKFIDSVFFRTTIEGSGPNNRIAKGDFTGSTFKDVIYKNLDCKNSRYAGSTFPGTKIGTSTFEHCNFTEADLTGIELDWDSKFPASNFKDAKIDRFTLDCIDDRQIPKSARVKMKITDDIAKLRLLYGGWRRMVNALSVLLFLSPYLFFLGKVWVYDSFFATETDPIAPIYKLIGRYIASGGSTEALSWETIQWQFIFMWGLAILFNGVRITLLIKTLGLEFLQKVRGGLPVKFSLDDPCLKFFKWRHLLLLAQFFFYTNIGLALYHTIQFLLRYMHISAV